MRKFNSENTHDLESFITIPTTYIIFLDGQQDFILTQYNVPNDYYYFILIYFFIFFFFYLQQYENLTTINNHTSFYNLLSVRYSYRIPTALCYKL